MDNLFVIDSDEANKFRESSDFEIRNFMLAFWSYWLLFLNSELPDTVLIRSDAVLRWRVWPKDGAQRNTW